MSGKRVFTILTALLVGGLFLFPRSASASVFFLTNYTADLLPTTDPLTGNDTISLLVNSTAFGPGGIASGQAAFGLAAPHDSRWLVDPFGVAPGDDTIVLSFQLDPIGNVSGITPQPFRIFLTTSLNANANGALFGELDFLAVTGSVGSLNLSGVVFHEVDGFGVRTGVSHTVAPFTLNQIPEPASAVLLLTGLAALGALSRKRRSKP